MTERLSDKNPCNDCRLYNPCTGPCDKWHEWNSSVLSKLAEYETAEEEGRLVVLPKCNIGDIVWLPIDFENKIYKGKVYGFEYNNIRKKWVVKIQAETVSGYCYEAFEDFGKTFFLTREEAEKSLEVLEEAKNE